MTISGVATVAIRSLAIAGESLTRLDEQDEVVALFSHIKDKTGWRVGHLTRELSIKWGRVHQTITPPSSAGEDGTGAGMASASSQGLIPTHPHAPGAGTTSSSAGTLQQQAQRLAQLHAGTPMQTVPEMQPYNHQPSPLQVSSHMAQQHHLSTTQPTLQGSLLTQPQTQLGQQQHHLPMGHMQYSQSNDGRQSRSSSMSYPQPHAPQPQRRASLANGMLNPLISNADFAMASHPFQNPYGTQTVGSNMAAMLNTGLGGFGY
jgi:hypothetical protein